MALFSLLHLFAFPWKEYDVRRSEIVAAESGPGFLMDPKTAYKGGTFGQRALMNAFNPWDLVKAVGRGFKWFAVGRRTREQDISYKNNAQGASLEPIRPDSNFRAPKPRPYHPLSDDDEQELLARAQTNPFADPDPHSRRWGPADGAGDIGAVDTAALYDERPDRLRTAHPAPGTMRPDYGAQELGVVERPAELGGDDIRYHGAAVTPAPAQSRPHQPSVEDAHDDGWDVWGGLYSRGPGAGGGGRAGPEFDGRNRF